MGSIAGTAFDELAGQYDQLWSTTPAGINQRDAVWEVLQQLFTPGETILDVGCGTGVDALFLKAAGIRVEGVDASSEMVRAAKAKGVSARHLAAEDLAELPHTYDGAISNFGALNCVTDLRGTAASLGRLIRPGGYLAVCTMGSFCLWESAYFLSRGELGKVARRWRPGTLKTSLGIDVQYPTIRHLARAFQSHFHLVRWKGVGIAVPPSYVLSLSDRQVSRLAKIDSLLSSIPLLRAISDHRLLVFVRI